MPNRVPIESVKSRLPSFVQIIPETYRGIRYEAEFIDTEFNQTFKAIVSAVIKHQHGCPERSNLRRSFSYGKRGTLADFKAKLPSYLVIYENTWKGIRYKACFRDTEYNEDFEAYCCNVVREGKGYCPSRKLAEFRKAIVIDPEEIQTRLDKQYGNEYAILIPESYTGTNEMASFRIKDRGIVRYTVDLACRGALNSNRCKQLNWRLAVLERDNNRCAITKTDKQLEAHHIFSKADNPALRFDPSNGITLSKSLHVAFHSHYGKTGTNAEQLLEFALERGVDLTERLGLDKTNPPASLCN